MFCGWQFSSMKKRLGLRLGHPLRHGHRLGAGGCLVQQRGIGNLEPGQIADHGLEVQQRLEPALADFRLIGGVGGVPGRVFQDVALDRGGRHRTVIALPDQRGQNLVLFRHPAQVPQQLALGLGLAEIQLGRLPDRLGHGLVDQVVETVGADHGQHLVHFSGRGADMAAVGEIIGQVIGGRVGHGSFPWQRRRRLGTAPDLLLCKNTPAGGMPPPTLGDHRVIRGSVRSALKKVHRTFFRARLTR